MEFVATKMGFRDGARIRPGESFDAPEGFKCTWAVSRAAMPAVQKPVGKQKPMSLSEVGKGKVQGFIEAHAKTDLA